MCVCARARKFILFKELNDQSQWNMIHTYVSFSLFVLFDVGYDSYICSLAFLSFWGRTQNAHPLFFMELYLLKENGVAYLKLLLPLLDLSYDANLRLLILMQWNFCSSYAAGCVILSETCCGQQCKSSYISFSTVDD